MPTTIISLLLRYYSVWRGPNSSLRSSYGVSVLCHLLIYLLRYDQCHRGTITITTVSTYEEVLRPMGSDEVQLRICLYCMVWRGVKQTTYSGGGCLLLPQTYGHFATYEEVNLLSVILVI